MKIIEKKTGRAIVYIYGDEVLLLDPRNYAVKTDKPNKRVSTEKTSLKKLPGKIRNGYVEPASYFPPNIRKKFFDDNKDTES